MRTRARARLASGVAVGASLALAGSARADVFTVNSTADPGTGTCDTSECTLREAVNAANVTTDADTINFSLPAGPQTINLNASQLAVTQSLTVDGTGEDLLTIDAGPGAGYNDTSRVFNVQGSSGAGVSFDLSDLTLSGGIAGASGGQARNGGAILSSLANLAIRRVTMSGNLATADGGALYFSGGSANPSSQGQLLLDDVTVSGNTSFAGAAGVSASNGFVDIADTEISGNDAVPSTAFSSPKYSGGGGLTIISYDFVVADTTITGNSAAGRSTGPGKYALSGGGGAILTGGGSIEDSTVTDNQAQTSGGGLSVSNGATVERTTVSGNSLSSFTGRGGGVHLEDADLIDSSVTGNDAANGGGVAAPEGENRIDGSTIAANTAAVGGGLRLSESARVTLRSSTISGNSASSGNGGGVYANDYDPPRLTIRSSILANNQPNNTDLDSDSPSRAATASFSLIEAPAPGTIAGDPASSNLIGPDPLLGPLADNGGPTETLLPAPTSPVIDAGIAGPLTTDQRGLARTVDAAAPNEPLSDGTDIGSVELAEASAPGDDDVTAPGTEITAGPSGTGNPGNASFEFRSPDDPGATFECSLDGAPFAACTSPVALSGLAGGPHSFEVRARDGAGNVDGTPAVRLFNVGVPPGGATPDTTAPATAITDAPTKLRANGRKPKRARIAFEGIDDVTSPAELVFECKLDRGAFEPCESPTRLKLRRGKRTIQVRAVDEAGNADPTPAKVKVRVKARTGGG